MSDHYIQEPLFYTEDEVTAKITEATSNLYTQEALFQFRENGLKSYIETVQRNILTVMRATELVDRETAIALYNEIADYYGWAHAEVVNEYEVCVDYNDTTIGTFTVEAEDEDSAIDLVRDNMESEATMTISLSFNDQTVEGEVYLSDYDLEDFSFTAQEA